MTDRQQLSGFLGMSAVFGGCATLGFVLCLIAYQRHHSAASIWGGVALACGLFVFLTSAWRLAQSRTRKSLRLRPSHD